jgi:hypothetical protein
MASDGRAALDAQIAKLRGLGDALTDAAAPAVAEAVQDKIETNIASGRGPDGKAWEPTATGRQPLQGALKAVETRAVGDTIVVTLEGHEVHHHRGDTRGNIQRQIIPTKKTPQPIARAIESVLADKFREHMGVRDGR